MLRVSTDVKAIRLLGVTVHRDPARRGEATFVAPDAAILKPGDLVFATSPGWVPESYTEARRSHGVCGVIASIEHGVVRMTSVVRGLADGLHDLCVRYWPRLHLPSSGMTTAGSDVIAHVVGAETWRRFDRISGAGIPIGAYVVEPIVPSSMRLRISTAATTTSARPIRLYGADIERFGEPFDPRIREEFESPASTKRPMRIDHDGTSSP
jgi:hypothetical protein